MRDPLDSGQMEGQRQVMQRLKHDGQVKHPKNRFSVTSVNNDSF